jgi:hypothetical protein
MAGRSSGITSESVYWPAPASRTLTRIGTSKDSDAVSPNAANARARGNDSAAAALITSSRTAVRISGVAYVTKCTPRVGSKRAAAVSIPE